MGLVVTVTLNPCLDKTVIVEGLRPGETNRILEQRTDPGGKGINVAVALHQLGIPVFCTGLGFGGGDLERALGTTGVPNEFVAAPGELRTNVKIFDASTAEMTELSQAGPTVTEETLERFLEQLSTLLEHCHLLVLSGSVPPGVPETIYADIIRTAKKQGAKTVLDASGAPMRHGIDEKPWLIKPNRLELEGLFQETIRDRQHARCLARTLIDKGISYVCLSMGQEGAMLVGKDEAYFSQAVDIPARSVHGAGDAMVAGICAAWLEEQREKEYLRWGMAAAHATLLREGTQMCTPEDFQRILPLICLEEI